MMRRSLFFLSLIFISATSRAAAPPLELIRVRADGFCEAGSGREFVPFGFNYFDPAAGWAPKIWREFDEARVRRHFELMRGLGVNVVRIFVAAAAFQPTADTIDENALKKMDAMVAIARAGGIRIIFTGPDHWEGAPAYWRPDRFCGEAALAALDRFWTVIGKRYAGEPAIFAWDLLNEPMIPWSAPGSAGFQLASSIMNQRWNAWLKTHYLDPANLKAAWGAEAPADAAWGQIPPPADKPAEGSPPLLDYQRFREEVADAWTKRQVAALRAADPTHPVTIGYIQWSYPFLRRPARPSHYAAFNPRRQAGLLDFMSIHFYPQLGDPGASAENARKNREYLQAAVACCAVGKPVFLQEYGWPGGAGPDRASQTPEEARKQAQYLEDVVGSTRRLARGWAAWPFADTPSSRDLTKFAGALDFDLKLKPWGERFKVLAAQPSVPLAQAPAIQQSDEAAALTGGEETQRRLHEEYVRRVLEVLGH